MKSRKTLIAGCCVLAALILTSAVSMAGCGSRTENITQLYSASQNGDGTYAYQITDRQGNVFFSRDGCPKEPDIRQVNADVLGITVQSGTGLSTNQAVFCDVEDGRVSETFSYVLGTWGQWVIYAHRENGRHFIIVQDIFDKAEYYQTHELENVSPVAADFTTGCTITDDGLVTVSYLTGDDYTQTDITIYLS